MLQSSLQVPLLLSPAVPAQLQGLLFLCSLLGLLSLLLTIPALLVLALPEQRLGLCRPYRALQVVLVPSPLLCSFQCSGSFLFLCLLLTPGDFLFSLLPSGFFSFSFASISLQSANLQLFTELRRLLQLVLPLDVSKFSPT